MFTTGSSYKGGFKNKRMEGMGHYTFTSGSKYNGYFMDNMFHGQGTLYTSDGGKFGAVWDKGKCLGPNSDDIGYVFPDGLEHRTNNWNYCSASDRRFHLEKCTSLKPAGRTLLTNRSDNTLKVPLDWYDCGDGFYNPEKRVVYTYHNKFLRNADSKEHDWIIKNCRKGVTDEDQLDSNGLYK